MCVCVRCFRLFVSVCVCVLVVAGFNYLQCTTERRN